MFYLPIGLLITGVSQLINVISLQCLGMTQLILCSLSLALSVSGLVFIILGIVKEN